MRCAKIIHHWENPISWLDEGRDNAMSNVAGKAYAMNVVTPLKGLAALWNRVIFWGAKLPFFNFLNGLLTLSLIHYAQWAIVRPSQFPYLGGDQKRETINYNYMFFFSNFNGSWTQYVDSFHMSIPSGLNLFWKRNIRYPGSVPLQPFHDYITFNQVWTNHYYNAYPTASSNDVKAAKRIKGGLEAFIGDTKDDYPDEFKKKYDAMLNSLQNDLSMMAPTPIVSLAAAAVADRRRQASG